MLTKEQLKGMWVSVQVGANWFNTRDTIRRVRYARDRGAGAVRICFPGWMIMTERTIPEFLNYNP